MAHVMDEHIGAEDRERDPAENEPLRISQSFTLRAPDEMLNNTLNDVIERAHHWARMPLEFGEEVQLALYTNGSYYGFHHDGHIRRATFILYLADTPEGDGGETIFPLIRAPHMSADVPPPLPPPVEGRSLDYPYDAKNPQRFMITRRRAIQPYCESDYYLKVRPKKGQAVLFHSFGPDGAYDEFTVHASCPLHRGEKLILQRWMLSERNTAWRDAALEFEDEKLFNRRINIGVDRHLPNFAQPGDAAWPLGGGKRSSKRKRRRRKRSQEL